MEITFCTNCGRNIVNDCLHISEVDRATIISCPICHQILAVKSEAVPDYEEYLLTVDQYNYTIHCLLKQEVKLKNALTQVHHTVTKLEILRELAREKEQACA